MAGTLVHAACGLVLIFSECLPDALAFGYYTLSRDARMDALVSHVFLFCLHRFPVEDTVCFFLETQKNALDTCDADPSCGCY